MYSSTLSLTSSLDRGGWSTPRPGRFTPGKETRYALYRRLGGPQGRSGQARKISPPSGLDPRTVQPVADRCTDYAVPAHIKIGYGFKLITLYSFVFLVVRLTQANLGIVPRKGFTVTSSLRSTTKPQTCSTCIAKP
jgi:hypothetical protein